MTFTFRWRVVYVSNIKVLLFLEGRMESEVIILEGLGRNLNSWLKQQTMTEKHKIKFQWFALKTHINATGIISKINNMRNRNGMLGQATC